MGLLTQLSTLCTSFCQFYLLPLLWDKEPGAPVDVEQKCVSIPKPKQKSKLYVGHGHSYPKAPKMDLLKSLK